ncbi:sigma-54-dependent Fis family transcriptional regulator [Treponema sp. OMZ 792]|uniref:sigma 54-interacting transcriptional regulator n=1 Tax=unclassified Treponema TaxID=2638727 RepID=UPI0020A544A8|nr:MULTISPECIES: sigma 54-interacting transcriptional regulator [unclassified Treponema]UTC74543.1 sigma-54-dependent Fis family transcriptional regulator [Treponema sp. OMZ 792]UTC77181.1 sigma-54-dependent Fis family transcriptional regulator [Treponema sp. OMZ 799]UTC80938.1 sigma-54-dependent Fis family transcriptional regulator [Treponema sp. OMZ 798]
MKNCVYAAYSEEDAKHFIKEVGSLWNVSLTFDSSKIVDLLKEKHFDFVIIDAESGGLFLPDIPALIKNEFPHIHVFIIIHCKQNDLQYNLLNSHVSKVFELPKDLKGVYDKIENFFFEEFCKEKELTYTKEDENTQIIKKEIIGISKEACDLREFIYRAANSNLPVLLSGETGSGKGLTANLIHRLSHVKDKKFMPINVSCIPESLAESFLFGTEEGSFTGAIKKEGAFFEASGGTIFLDEMETLSMDIQAKLLHVLESGLIRPVGSTKSKQVEFRLIAAANEDLQKMINEKKFRQDLYYRLDVLHHEIPPLRNRKEDIKYIVQAYLAKTEKTISDEAQTKLNFHNWPGNIRELFNCLDRACTLAGRGEKIENRHIKF